MEVKEASFQRRGGEISAAVHPEPARDRCPVPGAIGSAARRCATAALGAHGDRGWGAAHRVRERRQPPARARRRAPARDGGSPGARCEAAGVSCSSCWWRALLLALAGGLAGLALGAFGAPLMLGLFVSPDEIRGALGDAGSAHPRVQRRHRHGDRRAVRPVPALQSTRPSVAPTLKDQAGSVLGGGQVRLRKALVVSQVAVSLLLLIGAGLFLRTLAESARGRHRLRPRALVTFAIEPSMNGYTARRIEGAR